MKGPNAPSLYNYGAYGGVPGVPLLGGGYGGYNVGGYAPQTYTNPYYGGGGTFPLRSGFGGGSAAPGALQPLNKPDKYWKRHDWWQIEPHHQQQWNVLGWGPHNWDINRPKPRSYNTHWDQLSPQEQGAASYLGYTRYSWEATFKKGIFGF